MRSIAVQWRSQGFPPLASLPTEVTVSMTPPPEEYRTIPLTRGYVTLVDAADYDWLTQWKWQVISAAHLNYAARSTRCDGRVGTFTMHRALLGLSLGDGLCVDHIDRDGLNNRRSNLRIATRSQNQRNQGINSANTTGFKGVIVRHGALGYRWYARIKVNRKTTNLGSYSSAEDAARAYDEAAKHLHGEFAFLNFPIHPSKETT